jgi:VanZ family protein
MPTTDNGQLTTKTKPYAALPLGWAALLLYLTLAPADKLPPQPQWELLSFDTFAHAAFFAVQAALAWFSLRRQRRWPWLARHAGWVVLLGCTAFGALIEALQMALPFNRHGEWSDLLSDSIGTALALGGCYAVAPALRERGWALGVLAVLLSGQAAAQDVARARHTIEVLASPKMHGRGYVRQGEHIAAAYLRGRLKELKLTPLAPNYTQTFGLDVNTFPGVVKAELHSPIRSTVLGVGFDAPLKVGKDFIAAPNAGSVPKTRDYTCVRYDSTFFTNEANLVPDSADARRCLFLTQRQSQRLTKLGQQWLTGFGAVVTIMPKLMASLAAEQTRQPRLEMLPNALLPAAPMPAIEQLPASLGPQLRLQLDAQLQRNYQTQNLAAVVRGTAQPDSFLVVSAHYDHLGMMGKDVYFPGANDNASGVALLLELAAHYARPENRPAYSVVFLLFGAEEAGLVGSSFFVAHPLVPLKSIKFLINLDLLGTGEQGATVVNGRVFEAPYQRLVALNTARHYLPALAARGRAANSDHYPFSEAGVPAFFLYTRGGSTAYHDVHDQPAALSLAGFSGAFGLVRDFLNGEGAAPRAKK